MTRKRPTIVFLLADEGDYAGVLLDAARLARVGEVRPAKLLGCDSR